MKILFGITKANWGGAQRYVYDVASAAKAAGYEVAVAYGEPGLLATRLEEAGIRTIPLAGLTRDVGLVREWRSFFALLRVLRAERPDVLHLNSSKAGGLGCLAGRLASIPRIIFTAHGWAFNEARPWWQKLIIRKLSWWTIALSHQTIAVSDAVRRQVSWMPFAAHKLVLIRHGIECAPLLPREEARQKLLPRTKAPYWIGMLGELHRSKRAADAIEAFATLARDFTDAILIVLGEGEERARLEGLIVARGLSQRIFLPGFVADGPRYLCAFDLFLMPSRTEALGYALLEAGCAGLPAIASRVGGIPEIVEDGVSGLLVPPENPRELALAMRALMTDRPRAQARGHSPPASVQKNFSKRKMLDATLALY